ncbi:type II methionyl aminopeptidase [Desulfurococcaceae archaeon MEX13E-LK6-19]|nr:type II methionyl aminopeptidase [Desulfurococcaceae archaeon MEX13E-LK6-19]
MDEDIIKKYVKAGDIAKRVRTEAAKKSKPGMKLVELANYIEQRIRELGGEPAFPVNLSVNNIAAHYTPVIDDEATIPDNAVLKIDIGVHVDGYIADTAISVTFNPAYESLLEASEKALERALEIVKPGVKVSEIGKIIEETIVSMGYKPIRNLTGHSMDRYIIHSGLTIPNYWDKSAGWRLTNGAYAIEPFATTGIGLVREDNVVTIFSLRTGKPRTRLSFTEKKIVDYVWNTRKRLPFCERWLKSMVSSLDGLRNTISGLIRKGVVTVYPVLVEKTNGIVAQFEHTILISGKDVIVTTL